MMRAEVSLAMVHTEADSHTGALHPFHGLRATQPGPW